MVECWTGGDCPDVDAEAAPRPKPIESRGRGGTVSINWMSASEFKESVKVRCASGKERLRIIRQIVLRI